MVNAMTLNSEKSALPWQGAGLSHMGLRRSSNQDAFAVDNELGLWIVADGMGGRAGGDVASAVAVQALLDHFQRLHKEGRPAAFAQGDAEATAQLRRAIQYADVAIRDRALEQSDLTGMGTTIVAVVVSSLSPLQVAIGHVGDSRAYLYRDQELRTLTRDHSLVEDLLAKGQISPGDVSTHPQRHILVRALGIEDQTDPDIANQAIQPGDILLLCTDGITRMLVDQQMMAHLNSATHSLDDACRGLVSEANAHGGKDNSTAVVVRFS